MIRIDAHHHLWRYSSDSHPWIDDSMQLLKRNFLPPHLHKEMEKAGYHGSVVVQSSQTEDETRFLLRQAKNHSFIMGVVGWLDLRAPDIGEKLAHFSKFQALKGLRHVVQDEPDLRFMLRDNFLKGISMLKKYDLAYDILIFPKHLRVAEEMIRLFPDQKFVVNHIAKPEIAKGTLLPWMRDIEKLARHSNVYCKLSGMVTEAKWRSWKKDDFDPYIRVVYEVFGPERLMIGSDWPVCLLSADYQEVMGIAEDFFKNDNDAQRICGWNAIEFYGLQKETRRLGI